jgi:hypothetical protein
LPGINELKGVPGTTMVSLVSLAAGQSATTRATAGRAPAPPLRLGGYPPAAAAAANVAGTGLSPEETVTANPVTMRGTMLTLLTVTVPLTRQDAFFS